MDLKEVLKYLRENRYLMVSKGKYVLSETFQQDAKRSMSAQLTVETAIAVVENKIITTVVDADKWPNMFMEFIRAAQVPSRLEGARGESYYANKYSEPAMKVFRKAIESGVDLSILVKSTMLYYKSGVRFKKAISNYFVQGDWRSDYEALKSMADSGETELKDHIQTQLKNDDPEQYKFG
jgi:hypothetical protein